MKRLRYETKGFDRVDRQILSALAANARISIADLAREVGLSPPSVSERVKRLEEAGVIRRYTIVIDPGALGRPLAVWLRIRPLPGKLQRIAALLHDLPAIVECDRITGDDCFLARAHVASVQDLESLIDELIPYATTNTSVIQSSPIERRMPPIPLAVED